MVRIDEQAIAFQHGLFLQISDLLPVAVSVEKRVDGI